METSLRYQAYLLRCWEECDEPTGTLVWRFSLEDPRTGKRRGFATLMDLINALENELLQKEKKA